MKIFVIISGVLMAILAAMMVYLAWTRNQGPPESNEPNAIFKARQESVVKSQMRSAEAAGGWTPGVRPPLLPPQVMTPPPNFPGRKTPGPSPAAPPP
jgi:hypothetical protein